MSTTAASRPSSTQRQRALNQLIINLPRLVIGLALLIFIGYFIVYCIYAFALFQFPFDYDQGEGFELMDTLLFSQGQWPYRDNNSYPFYSSNYPPLFHVAIVPLVWLFGPQYWTGRLVSWVGTLLTAVFISTAVHKAGKRWWLTTLSGLAFLASNYVYHVGPLFRQHMFMVMFETAAVVLMAHTIQREEREKRPYTAYLIGVMAMLLLAGYTKQLAYATVIAVFAFWLLRQPLRAIKWAIPFGIVTGLVFLWIDLSTDGYWFLNTVTANINPFVPGQAQGLFRQWFRLHTVLIVVSAIYAIYQLYFERLSIYSVWFVVATINSVTAGKWGAGESYFATAIAASCILTGLAFHRVLKWGAGIGERGSGLKFTIYDLRFTKLLVSNLLLLGIGILFIYQGGKMFHMPTHTPFLSGVAQAVGQPTEVMIAPQTSCSAPRPAESIPYVDSAGVSLLGRPPSPEDTLAGQEIAAFVASGETAAFSEDASFNFYNNRDIVTNPTQLLNLYNNNSVDITEMVTMLNNQAFDTVVLRAQFYPPPVLDAIGQQYETVKLVQMNGFVYCLMEPRN